MGSKNQGIKQFQVLPANKVASQFLQLFTQIFPSFPKSKEFANATKYSQNERNYSDALAKFWSFHGGGQFILTPESPNPSSRAVDFDVSIWGGVRIMTIEAKVFPIPTAPGRNEWEYVHGTGGGMERYRDEHHGFDYNPKHLFLDIAMIGYVKSGEFSSWHLKVNKWITNANWPTSEHIKEISCTKVFAQYKSDHIRKSGGPLVLHHFWVLI